MIFILTKRPSERLRYACEQIFTNMLHLTFDIVSHVDNKKPEDIVLGYGTSHPDADVSMYQSSFILQTTAPDEETFQNIIQNDWPYFKCQPGEFDFETDVFSLCFFALSRYEEYLIYEKDDFGRISSKQSVFYRDQLLKSPHVDKVVYDLWQTIQSKKNQLLPGPKPGGIYLSFDIDHGWKYKNKGLIRNLGGAVKDLLKLKLKIVFSRFMVLTGVQKDPYFTFHEIFDLADKVPLRFFILLGDYNKIDININYKNKSFQQIIKTIASQYPLGIHPSSKASVSSRRLHKEIRRLENITGLSTKMSRQHYLMLKIPDTFHYLIENGIEHDYTMGYADSMGFRAGTAHSFKWFDLTANKTTNLWVHPFAAMDVAMRDYEKLNEDTAFFELSLMLEQIKITGGNLEILWHNSSFIDHEGWGSWKRKLTEFIEKNSAL